MKANQVQQELPKMPAKYCVVCGEKTAGYGYVNHGYDVICSKECDNRFKANRCKEVCHVGV